MLWFLYTILIVIITKLISSTKCDNFTVSVLPLFSLNFIWCASGGIICVLWTYSPCFLNLYLITTWCSYNGILLMHCCLQYTCQCSFMVIAPWNNITGKNPRSSSAKQLRNFDHSIVTFEIPHSALQFRSSYYPMNNFCVFTIYSNIWRWYFKIRNVQKFLSSFLNIRFSSYFLKWHFWLLIDPLATSLTMCIVYFWLVALCLGYTVFAWYKSLLIIVRVVKYNLHVYKYIHK